MPGYEAPTNIAWSEKNRSPLVRESTAVTGGLPSHQPRVADIGLETVGVEADRRGIPVDASLRAGERLWALGDVTGIWPLTHVGKY